MKPKKKTIDTVPMRNHYEMRHTKEIDSPHMREETATKLYSALSKKYPGKVWRVIEVCPVAVVKTIDNERDALETLRRLQEAGIEPVADTVSVPRELLESLRRQVSGLALADEIDRILPEAP